MSEDPTRAMVRPSDPGSPAHGRVGPVDPHADPATDPGLRPAGPLTGGEPRYDAPTIPTAGDTAPDGTAPGGAAPGGAPPADTAPPDPVRRPPVVGRTRTGGLWTGLILSAVVLVFLLIFILQNDKPVEIKFLTVSGMLPSGVALLLAAIAGLLLVAIPGALRILQLRRVARRGPRR